MILLQQEIYLTSNLNFITELDVHNHNTIYKNILYMLNYF